MNKQWNPKSIYHSTIFNVPGKILSNITDQFYKQMFLTCVPNLRGHLYSFFVRTGFQKENSRFKGDSPQIQVH